MEGTTYVLAICDTFACRRHFSLIQKFKDPVRKSSNNKAFLFSLYIEFRHNLKILSSCGIDLVDHSCLPEIFGALNCSETESGPSS